MKITKNEDTQDNKKVLPFVQQAHWAQDIFSQLWPQERIHEERRKGKSQDEGSRMERKGKHGKIFKESHRIMEKQGHPNDFEMFTKEEIDALWEKYS